MEGPDDKHVVLQLRQRVGSIPEFSITAKGGVGQVLDAIGLEVRVSGRKTVGILVDANENLASRWQAVRDKLRKEGVELPATIEPTGAIIEGDLREGRPRVGVWLMPDNTLPGEIEDFVAAMIPEDDPVWPLSGAYIGGIPEPYRKFTPGKTRRAEVHAWLAARERPRLMGVAIRARDLDVDGAGCKSFVDWLRRLFREPEN